MPPTNRLEVQVRASNSPTRAAPLSGGPGQSIDFFHTFTEGLNLGQVDHVFYDERTLVMSGTEDLDLSGTLKECDGITNVTLTRLRVAAFYNEGPGEMLLSRPAANGVVLFSAAVDQIVIPAGAVFLWACSDEDSGIVVTPVTGDLLTVTEGGSGPITYKVLLAGI
jgi:hypothetical protein